MIEVKKLLHASVDVEKNYEKSKDFYERILGLKADAKIPNIPDTPGVWLDIGENQIHIVARDRETYGPLGTNKFDIAGPHIALAVKDLAAAKRALKDEGYKIFETTVVGGIKQLFIRDPAGNLVELQQAR